MKKENLWNFNDEINPPPKKSNKNEQNSSEKESSESSSSISEEEISRTIKITKETCKGFYIDRKNYEKLLNLLNNLISINQTLRKELIKIKFEKETQTNEIKFFDNETLTKFKLEYENKISNLNNSIQTLTKEKETIINSNKIEIGKLKESYTNEIENLNKKIKYLKEHQISKEDKFSKIYSHPKILHNIIKYLKQGEKLNFARVNSKFWHEFFFKTMINVYAKKLKQKNKIIEKVQNENFKEKFGLDINNNEINNLFNEYVIENKISGKSVRNEICKSILFLEKYVKIPMKNFIGPGTEINVNAMYNKENTLEKFQKKIKNIVSNKNNNNISNNNNIINNYPIIQFTENEFKNIFETEKNLLNIYKINQSINIPFEYSKPEIIKKLLDDFFKLNLPKTSYEKFLSKICEIFSDLLFSSYNSLSDIKNLELIKYCLYIRYMKLFIKCQELQNEISDLQKFADESKELKNLLTTQKNEIERKYNNNLILISQIKNEGLKDKEEIKNLKEKIKNSQNEIDEFKNKVMKEYYSFKNEYEIVKKEKGILVDTFIQLKDYFMKFINEDGEILLN